MKNIEIYYESIKQVHNQILEWENRPPPFRQRFTNTLVGISIVIFVLSLIPILPSLIVFIGSRFDWNIGSMNLNNSTILTYGLAWLLSAILTFLLVLGANWLDNKFKPIDDIEKMRAPQTLSSEQLVFIFAYEAYKELKIFFVSRIDQHVQKSLSSLNKLRLSDRNYVGMTEYSEILGLRRELEMISLAEAPIYSSLRARPALNREISIAHDFLRTFEKYPWFHIDNLTKSRLQALISFQRKINIRLQKREDLPAVLSILENFSKFLYAYLPEHQTNMDGDDLQALQAEGTNCLDKFVEEVNDLMEIPSEETMREKDSHSPSPKRLKRLQFFYSSNVFFRFTIWLIFLIAITSGLVFLTSKLNSQLDINIMVSMIIATSVTGAAALAVFGGRNAKSVQVDEHNEIDTAHDTPDGDGI